ncbi:MAG: RNA polymerase sigma factor [Chloroflexi bacterium]|nr:MAG: RNA polymerase sigma factor [Chloroflexota bacterium]
MTAALVRFLGDFDLGEELVQESVVEALQHWPAEGIPQNPGAWLMTTARRKALDRIRRGKTYLEKLSLLVASSSQEVRGEQDDRLRLIFTCCHPALSREAQVALTLRAVIGLTTPEIARAFLTSEATMAQRIVRAKRKIVEAGIPYRMPDADELSERLDEVLAVLYLAFNEGYLATSGPSPARRDLAEDACWLSTLLMRLLPNEPEVIGLVALMQLHLARATVRFDRAGGLILLKDQDRSRWDQRSIREASTMLERASWLRRPGPYQLQAAIAACHAEATSWEATDWAQILLLYNSLLIFWPTPVVRLNRAIAVRHVAGPKPALAELESLADELKDYHLYHSTRAQLLRELGRESEVPAALNRALELTENPAERALLRQRIG